MANPTLNDVRHLLARPGVAVQGFNRSKELDAPASLPLLVSLPIAVKSPNGGWGNQRGKAMKARRERLLTKGALTARYGINAPKPPLVVTLERRIPKGGRMLDDDNVAYAFKHIRDGVADWLGVNDGPKSGVTWRYAQARDPESSLGTVGITLALTETV